MSKIDEAFAKAFARDRSADKTTNAPPADGQPAALGSYSICVDAMFDAAMRVDAPQSVPRPHIGRVRVYRSPPVPPESSVAADPRGNDQGSHLSDSLAHQDSVPRPQINRFRVDREGAEVTRQPVAPDAPKKGYPASGRRLTLDAFAAITVTHDRCDQDPEPHVGATLPRPEEVILPVEGKEHVDVPETIAQPKAHETSSGEDPVADTPEASVAHAPQGRTVTPQAMPDRVDQPPSRVAEMTPPESSPIAAPVADASVTAAIVGGSVETGPAPFEAAWEVDQFEVPRVVEELLTRGGLLSSGGIPLAKIAQEGLQRLVVVSAHPNAGRSTVALGLALAGASAGVRVALIDADFGTPSLVDDLQLEIEFGWPEAVRGGVAITETAIHSIADNVTLFPLLADHPGSRGSADELQRMLGQLRNHFDLLIVDGPEQVTALPADTFQSAILVRDMRSFDRIALEQAVEDLENLGIQQVGIADNFVTT